MIHAPLLLQDQPASRQAGFSKWIIGLVLCCSAILLCARLHLVHESSEQESDVGSAAKDFEIDTEKFYYAFHGSSKEGVAAIVKDAKTNMRMSKDGKFGPGVYLTFLDKKANKYAMKARTMNSWVRSKFCLSENTHILVVQFDKESIASDDLSTSTGEHEMPNKMKCGDHGTSHHEQNQMELFAKKIYYPICKSYSGPYRPHKENQDFSEFIVDGSIITDAAELPLDGSEAEKMVNAVATSQAQFCSEAKLGACEGGDDTSEVPDDAGQCEDDSTQAEGSLLRRFVGKIICTGNCKRQD